MLWSNLPTTHGSSGPAALPVTASIRRGSPEGGWARGNEAGTNFRFEPKVEIALRVQGQEYLPGASRYAGSADGPEEVMNHDVRHDTPPNLLTHRWGRIASRREDPLSCHRVSATDGGVGRRLSRFFMALKKGPTPKSCRSESMTFPESWDSNRGRGADGRSR